MVLRSMSLICGGPKKTTVTAPEVQLGPHVLPLREQARVLCFLDYHVVLG